MAKPMDSSSIVCGFDSHPALVNKLPSPDCETGYTRDQLREILGNRFEEFDGWMYGQTVALCEGRKWNYYTKEYEETDCGPHGPVVYSWDLKRFLDGRPIID